MSEVKFISPETIEQAVDAYSKSSKEGKTKILAGGTDLLVQIRSGISQPDTIIDIKNILFNIVLPIVKIQEVLSEQKMSFSIVTTSIPFIIK